MLDWCVEWEYLRVDLALANSPGDKLAVLSAEVEDNDEFVLYILAFHIENIWARALKACAQQGAMIKDQAPLQILVDLISATDATPELQ